MSSLTKLRDKIDAVDKHIIQLLTERQALVQSVVEVKWQEKLPIFQPEREMAMFEKLRGYAQAVQLSPQFIQELFESITTESKRLQTEWLQQRVAEKDE